MSVLFIGKRFYANRDALRERYGRIYQLPYCWAAAGIPTTLWLVDYHTREGAGQSDGQLDVISTPIRNLALLRKWWQVAHRRDNKVDTVVASGDCYIGWMGLRIARRLGARFVFDVYDKYDEFTGYCSPLGFNLFSSLLRDADVRLFASHALAKSMGALGALNIVVPNGIDPLRFRVYDRDASRTLLRLDSNATYVGYFGSLTPDRGVSDLVDAVCILRDEGRDISVLLAGYGDSSAWADIPWVRNLGNLAYEQVVLAMACCDVLALPYRRSDYLDMASSCKIAEYLAVERPIAATDTPNFGLNFPDQVKQLNGLLARPGDSRDLARVIAAQVEQRRLASSPRDFSWCTIAGRLSEQLGLASEVAVVGATA